MIGKNISQCLFYDLVSNFVRIHYGSSSSSTFKLYTEVVFLFFLFILVFKTRRSGSLDFQNVEAVEGSKFCPKKKLVLFSEDTTQKCLKRAAPLGGGHQLTLNS